MSTLQQTLVRQSRNPFRTHELTNILFPSLDGGWRDIYRSGWLPGWFNQQWGGAQVGHEMIDSATGQTYKFDAATGYVQDDTGSPFLHGAGATWGSQGFKVSETGTISAVWLKLNKVGNPTNNLQLYILPDDGSGTKPTGSTPITNGTATAVSMKVFSSSPEWYRFVFPTPPSLTAGTQYHLVFKSSGAVDASNYITIRCAATGKYPFGNYASGDGTPTWTATAAYDMCFMVENSSKFLQASGQFDSKLVFGANTTLLNQQKVLSQPARNFFDGKNGTILFRGNAPISSTVADFAYGLDHDRIVLTTNASGYPVVTLYTQDRTVYTVTGSSSITSGNNDVAVAYRTVGDGADYLRLYVNGSAQGTHLSAQTFVMDLLFRDLGTAWLGGGFPLAPTWTHDLQMTALPSTLGWTWTGAATEANAMSVANGKLYQNKGGYTSAQDGYYVKSSAGFNNATGWTVSAKVRVSSGTNTASSATGSVVLQIADGAKIVSFVINEYFCQVWNGPVGSGTILGYPQFDFKSQDVSLVVAGKGSDFYVFANGKLLFEGTGYMTTASGGNSVNFGDVATTASENADVIWSYVKYYTGGMLLPSAASGATLNEFAYWSGNKYNLLRDLYNSGTYISAKQYCGLEKNYLGDGVVQKEIRRGVSSSITTTSTTPVAMTDIESFVLGSYLRIDGQFSASNSAAASVGAVPSLDGFIDNSGVTNPTTPAGYYCTLTGKADSYRHLGLHKAEFRWNVSSGTATMSGVGRVAVFEAKS